MKKFIQIFLILSSAFQASAQTDIAIAGVGTLSCGKYVNYRRQNTDLTYIHHWIQGYLSAVNTERINKKQKTIDIPEVQTLELMLENACLKNPEYVVWVATEIMSRDLISKLR